MHSSKLIRVFFHKDSLLLIAVVAFVWFTVMLTVDQETKLEDLKVRVGRVTSVQSVITKVVDKPLFKEKTWELRLILDSDSDFYFSSSTNGFQDVLDNVGVGHKVQILSHQNIPWLRFNEFKIYDLTQLATNRHLIRFEDKQNKIRNLHVMTGIATFGFLLWYLYKILKRIGWNYSS